VFLQNRKRNYLLSASSAVSVLNIVLVATYTDQLNSNLASYSSTAEEFEGFVDAKLYLGFAEFLNILWASGILYFT
jgi:hypothetical protein